jgi:hypothetical protein
VTWEALMQRMKALEATRTSLGRCACGRRPCFCGTCHDCEQVAFRQLNIMAMREDTKEVVQLRQRIREQRGR